MDNPIITLPATTIQTVIAKYISIFKVEEQTGKKAFLVIRALKKASIYFGILLLIYLSCGNLIAKYQKIPMYVSVAIMGVILYLYLLL